MRDAKVSVWIATANVKELMVEDWPRRVRASAQIKRADYISVLARLDELAPRGVELRLLHAEIPSRPFRAEIAHIRAWSTARSRCGAARACT